MAAAKEVRGVVVSERNQAGDTASVASAAGEDGDMSLEAILDDHDLCLYICNELDPDWRAHYLCDAVLAVSQLAMLMPETVMEMAREMR
jgi:hypothetical protein